MNVVTVFSAVAKQFRPSPQNFSGYDAERGSAVAGDRRGPENSGTPGTCGTGNGFSDFRTEAVSNEGSRRGLVRFHGA